MFQPMIVTRVHKGYLKAPYRWENKNRSKPLKINKLDMNFMSPTTVDHQTGFNDY